MAFQTDPPVTVYNGPDAAYQVAGAYAADGAVTQLVGVDDRWLDAFGRMRVSSPATLLELSFTYDLQPLLVEQITATNGTVAHNADSQSAVLTVSTDDGSSAALQTRRFAPYEKGRSQLVSVTFTFGAAVADVRRRVGYFETADGFYLEQTDAGVSFVRRSSTTGSIVNTAVTQTNWNLDPLDGTGPSGHTLDLAFGQILVIDGQWLGVGRVRMGFNIDGGTVWCHEFLHANVTATQPYTTTFALPVRWEIAGTDASAGGTMQAICCDVESEGGTSNPTALEFAAANVADVNTSTTRAAVLSLRPASVVPAGGPVNRTTIVPSTLSAISIGANALIEVFYDGTLTGGTWTRHSTSSAVEYGLGQTLTGGVLIDAFFVPSGAGRSSGAGASTVASQLPLVLDAAGSNPKALTVTATTLTGTGTVRAAINWAEVR